MSRQTKHATRLAAEHPGKSHPSKQDLHDRSALGLSPEEELYLDLIRLNGVAASHPEDQPRKAAQSLASARMGSFAGPVLIAAIDKLMHEVRASRTKSLAFLPPCCTCVTPDELDLMSLIRSARFPRSEPFARRIAAVIGHRGTQSLELAAVKVVQALRGTGDQAAGSPNLSTLH